MSYFLPDGVYNVLKWVGLTAFPALAVLVGTVGEAWGLPCVDAVVTTINAAGVFIGALLAYSQGTAVPEA